MEQNSHIIPTHDEVERSKDYGRIASKWHRFYKGKMSAALKVPVRSLDDFAIWYTPGIAQPCREIAKDPEKIFDYTNLGNLIAIVTDGSRILGLGNIGKAGLPVMEGKALLYKYLGDVDALPLCLSTQDPNEIVQAVKWIAPSFGGINLEDIDAPKCFHVSERLSRELEIPVFHDDQQGTAIVVLAGLLNAAKVVGKKLSDIRLTVLGAGTAAIASTKLLIEAGVRAENTVMVDSKGALYDGRPEMNKYKAEMARRTNKMMAKGGIKDALKGVDAVVALSKPGPGVITEEMVSTMADGATVFALANPDPEILPDEAKKGGARVVATGRGDYPNQVNNSICFPGVFRGLLDVRAKGINTPMMLAAAYEIGRFAEGRGLNEDYIVPTMMDTELYPMVAAAVGKAAIDSGVARIRLSYEEIRESAATRISKYRKSLQLLMKEGFIAPPPNS